ncbi:MAG: M28 family peptidase [Victivallaceae bacterium]|nr:M28 family peptidase [Victivallaceae bacterium]
MNTTAENLKRHLSYLTEKIGVRLAGSPAERQAAEYIAAECRKYAPRVTIEEFPVNERCVTSEKLEVEIDGVYREFPASLFSSASTTDGKAVEAELVTFDLASGYQRKDLSHLAGKAVIHLGCHLENENDYRRLMEAKPAFILFVDVRYTGTIPLADGLFPAYAAKYGACPCLDVAYMDAWKWVQSGAKKARICVTGGSRKSKTTVVVCEIPGTDPDAGVIYAGGHHDTQAGTVGADDNAIGSAAVIEMARILSQTPHRKTFRLCSFGAEEQLSLGSASYVRAHRAEIEKDGVFMCNFDSMGSALGWNVFTTSIDDALRAKLYAVFNRNDLYFKENTAPDPYTDQFPFAAAKVPGIRIGRKNCTAGIYYHHRRDNDLSVIGFDVAATLVEAAAQFVAEIADETGRYHLDAAQQREIDRLFNAVYGGF